jgi:hypothetical protein
MFQGAAGTRSQCNSQCYESAKEFPQQGREQMPARGTVLQDTMNRRGQLCANYPFSYGGSMVESSMEQSTGFLQGMHRQKDPVGSYCT